MTMPQMPRPGQHDAATDALTAALRHAQQQRQEAQDSLEQTRQQAHAWEADVREYDDRVRQIQAALDKLRGGS